MKRLVMIFQTDQGKTLRMTLPYPKDGLTAETVSTAMNNIIASHVVQASTGVPDSAVSAYIEEVSRIELF